jgi:hypothetical protein
MARCYLTGVEIKLDDAFVLDLTIAYRTVRELKEKVATLERLIAQLGRSDEVPIPDRGGTGTHLRKDRRVVSGPVAVALGAVCPDRELFLPWAVWHARGRTLRLSALCQHPDYGARIRELSVSEQQQIVTLAHQVLRRVASGAHLPDEVRTAVLAGVCVTLRERSAEEVVAILKHRIEANESLEDLGVPTQIEVAFRDALRRRPAEAWGAPEIQASVASASFQTSGQE